MSKKDKESLLSKPELAPLPEVPNQPEIQQNTLKTPKNGEGSRKDKVIARLKKIRFRQKHLAFPYGVMVVVFVIIPLLVMLVAAFRNADGGFTFKNFDKLWAEGKDSANLWTTIGRTLFLALLTTVICLLISYPLAMALCAIKVNKRAVLVMLFVAPMWINSLLRLYAIKLLFAGLESRSDYPLMLIGMVYDFLPFMMLPLYTSMANIDRSYLEAAGDLGASPITTLVKVRLPLSVPGIVSGAIMVFMPAMSTFAAGVILTDNTFSMFGNIIAERLKFNAADGVGAAYSLLLLLIMGITFFGANRFTKVKISSKGEGVL